MNISLMIVIQKFVLSLIIFNLKKIDKFITDKIKVLSIENINDQIDNIENIFERFSKEKKLDHNYDDKILKEKISLVSFIHQEQLVTLKV